MDACVARGRVCLVGSGVQHRRHSVGRLRACDRVWRRVREPLAALQRRGMPRAPTAATLIEFSHRLTSGLALVSVIILLLWTWRSMPKGHPARTGAALSVFFMLTEAAVGAGLVLFALVADNASMARALFVAVHLLNTFVLLACIALTAWWLSGGAACEWTAGTRRGALIGLCAALLVSSSSGAIAALGDTAVPAGSLTDALRADLSPTSHMLIRSADHPPDACRRHRAGARALCASARARRRRDRRTARDVRRHRGLVQIAAGVLNVLLLAPVWMQMVHLLVADVLWISVVLLSAAALSAAASPGTPAARRSPVASG